MSLFEQIFDFRFIKFLAGKKKYLKLNLLGYFPQTPQNFRPCHLQKLRVKIRQTKNNCWVFTYKNFFLKIFKIAKK